MPNEYTQEQLKAAFDKVCNLTDWKAPIRAYIRAEESEIVGAAIEHFTGTQAFFSQASLFEIKTPGWVFVSAVGYGAGPCGDH